MRTGAVEAVCANAPEAIRQTANTADKCWNKWRVSDFIGVSYKFWGYD
jgi:hypothetical protein